MDAVFGVFAHRWELFLLVRNLESLKFLMRVEISNSEILEWLTFRI